MNLRRAFTYIFADPSWLKKVGLIVLVSPVPIFGQLYALGYSNLALRRMVKGLSDDELPPLKLGADLFWRGVKVLMLTLICGIAVGLLAAPLYFGQEASAEAMAPAIVQALSGPSSLLVTIISTVVSGVVLARFALTGSMLAGFSLARMWALLRAEPSIWITYTVVGFILTEGPYGLVWVLPFREGWDVAATIAASTVIWTYGQMINAHLIGQAYIWSNRSAALRAAQIGYQR